MRKTYFVTGTDTDVGKTVVAAGLLEKFNQMGLSTAAVKPVAAGCELTADGLRNSDALHLQAAASLELSYDQINPVALEPAIAPHIAAAQEGRRLSASRLAGFCRGVMMSGADVTVIEGAGGWRVPLNERETVAHLAKELNVPVILVVGMKLGCINHALLTTEAIMRDGLKLAGWVANSTAAEMNSYQENLDTLKQRLPCPLVGEVPYLTGNSAESSTEPSAVTVAEYLHPQALTE